MSMPGRLSHLILAFLFIVNLHQPSYGAPWYVDDSNIAGPHDGTQWQSAFRYLQDALDASMPGDTIKVAQGIHFSDDDGGFHNPSHVQDSRSESFKPKEGITIEGGYIGFDHAAPDTRDITNFVTILSGDLTQNDTPNLGNYDENAYHVVDLSITNDESEINGLTITHGYAHQFVGLPSAFKKSGGGIFSDKAGGVFADARVSNCIITGCSAESGGGGVYVRNVAEAGLRFNNCIITGNEALGFGGGVYNTGAVLQFVGCTISSNACVGTVADQSGGGLYLVGVGETTLRNTQILDNSAAEGGGIYRSAGDITLRDCLIQGNTASEGLGGGIAFTQGGGFVVLEMINCDIIENYAVGGERGGGGLYVAPHSGELEFGVDLVNCRFIGNVATGEASGGAIWGSVIKAFSITNCLFAGNVAEDRPGGALFISSVDDDGFGTVSIKNCTIADSRGRFQPELTAAPPAGRGHGPGPAGARGPSLRRFIASADGT